MKRITIILLICVAAVLTAKAGSTEDLVKLADEMITANSTEIKLAVEQTSSNQDQNIEVEIWNSPQFRKQFVMSYMAETEIEPSLTEDELEVMKEFMELMSSEQMDEAEKLLKENNNDAASAVFDFTLANIYFQNEELDRAIIVYKMAVEKFPKFLRAWKNLSLCYVRQNYFDKAIPALTKVIELGGSNSITYGLLGFSYASVGNHLAAESAFRMAILLDSKTLDWKMGLARSFFKQQRYGESAAICEQLIEEYPDRADLWLLQANAYIGQGKALKAAEIYELVDNMGKSTFESLNMLGDIYINEELYEMATQAYMRAMEAKPDHKPERPIRSAKILIARGALNQTRQLITKIEDMHKGTLPTENHKELLKLKARLAVADGSGEEEVAVLEEIVAIDPLDGEALILLGQNSERNDDVEKAIFYYERAAGIDKYEADAKLRLAQLNVKLGKYNEAVSLLKRVQMLKPRDNVQKYLEQVERVAKNP